MLIGATEITLYSIGGTLIGYAATFLGHITNVMMPDILKASGRGDHAELRWLMGKGTRVTMFCAVPILVGFMTLGGEFIAVWMGPGYAASAWVLLILTAANFGRLANGPVSTALVGLGHVRLWAAMSVVQSLATLVLSVGLVLLTNLGIYGIALGRGLAPHRDTQRLAVHRRLPQGACKSRGGAPIHCFPMGCGSDSLCDSMPCGFPPDSAPRMAAVLAEGRNCRSAVRTDWALCRASTEREPGSAERASSTGSSGTPRPWAWKSKPEVATVIRAGEPSAHRRSTRRTHNGCIRTL